MIAWLLAVALQAQDAAVLEAVVQLKTRKYEQTRERELAAPFNRLTTREARTAVPLLLELLEDQTLLARARGCDTWDYRVGDRARAALERISFRSFGDRPRLLAEAREWWKANQEAEIDAWRRIAIEQLLAPVRRGGAQDGIHELWRLAAHAEAVRNLLREEERALLLGIARSRDKECGRALGAWRYLVNARDPGATELAPAILVDTDLDNLGSIVAQWLGDLGVSVVPTLLAAAKVLHGKPAAVERGKETLGMIHLTLENLTRAGAYRGGQPTIAGLKVYEEWWERRPR